MLYTWNEYNIVNQLTSVNKNKPKKQEGSIIQAPN